jgi:DNA-binding NarL/FixJ family response regulator
MERANVKKMPEAGAVGPQAGFITVAVIEDQREIREGLAALINGTTGFGCTGAYASMETALRGIPKTASGIALVDIDLPGMSGIEGVRLLRAEWPTLVPLILTVYDDDDRVLDALCAGANGYLLKNTPPVRLLECIRDAANGGAPMSPEVARRVIEVFRRIRPPANAEYHLTPHESRILKLLVEGENYKTAAVKLDVTVNTISYHVRRIYEKLQVHSRTEAVAKALRSGIFK